MTPDPTTRHVRPRPRGGATAHPNLDALREALMNAAEELDLPVTPRQVEALAQATLRRLPAADRPVRPVPPALPLFRDGS